jgi:thiosulfate dehydrogenase
MKPKANAILAAMLGAALGAGAVYFAASTHPAPAMADPLPTHRTAVSDNGVVVELCDGVTTMKVPGLKPGQRMSREQALAVTRALMEQWERKHPGEHWQLAQEQGAPAASQAPSASEKPSASEAASPSEAATTSTPAASPAAQNTPAQEKKANEAAQEKKEQTSRKAEQAGNEAAQEGGRKSIAGPGKGKPLKIQQGDTYASFTNRDYKMWQNETDKFVAEGKAIFHDANQLGSTIGVSCDMCHPDASNTHPETYPKYQVQLQRVALLRDMIDWCIENPVKGKTLSPNDEKLRALEAYILAQRKGVALSYGKH